MVPSIITKLRWTRPVQKHWCTIYHRRELPSLNMRSMAGTLAMHQNTTTSFGSTSRIHERNALHAVWISPHDSTIPNVTSADAAAIAATDLIYALTNPAPTAPSAPPKGEKWQRSNSLLTYLLALHHPPKMPKPTYSKPVFHQRLPRMHRQQVSPHPKLRQTPG